MPFECTPAPRVYASYRNVRCDGCNVELRPVTPTNEDGSWSSLQPDDALEIKLIGGYGMAIDPCRTFEGETQVFCKDCVRKLCEQWPSIAKVVMEHCSSSLGHDCQLTKKFEWTPCNHCDIYCRVCHAWAMNDRAWCEITGKGLGDAEGRPFVDHCGQRLPALYDWEITGVMERCQKHDRVLRPKEGCYLCQEVCKICKGREVCQDCPDPQGTPPQKCRPECTTGCKGCNPKGKGLWGFAESVVLDTLKKGPAPVWTLAWTLAEAEGEKPEMMGSDDPHHAVMRTVLANLASAGCIRIDEEGRVHSLMGEP